MSKTSFRGEDITEETKILISSLPSTINFLGNKLCKYKKCWYYYKNLQGVINFQRGFKPQETDIILASFPKSGTTWLKALIFAITKRSKFIFDDNHPLLSENPHTLVPFLELNLYLNTQTPDLTMFSSSPRLFSTHMPLHTLKEPLKNSSCKFVYVCRNVKDVLVSFSHFICNSQNKKLDKCILELIFNAFCNGDNYSGPFWENVLSYWKGSLEDPKHVLFMRYEELKTDPCGQVKRLAEFLGCPFSEEEEHNGFVEKILELCSLNNLSNLEVNKDRKLASGLDNKHFFRKGEVGDWKNHLTSEMENKIDMIIEEKLRGSGLKL